MSKFDYMVDGRVWKLTRVEESPVSLSRHYFFVSDKDSILVALTLHEIQAAEMDIRGALLEKIRDEVSRLA